MKPTRNIHFINYVDAAKLWPHDPTCVGKQVINGVSDHGTWVRSSLIVAKHPESQTIETKNTMYKVIGYIGNEKAF